MAEMVKLYIDGKEVEVPKGTTILEAAKKQCIITGTEMKRRIKECKRRGVPITNYGVTISKLQGVLERVIKPFYWE